MKVGFVLQDTPNASSKKYNYMLDALRVEGCEIIPIYPIKSVYIERIMIGINVLSKLICGKRIAPFHSYFVSLFQSRKLLKLLQLKNPDIIFAPFGASGLYYYNKNIPVIYCSDTTFFNMIDYYPAYSKLWKASINRGNDIERRAIERSFISVFSSKWAARSAMIDYGAPANKVRVIPFGANLENEPLSLKKKSIGNKDKIKLLFLSVEWERKGGDIALKTLKILKKAGFNVELIICGVSPPEEILFEDITVIPMLDKNDPEDLKKYNSILINSHFLLLPVRAECMGHVFCEASAYGVPSITTDTGGVKEVVRDSVNGYTLLLDETGKNYANKIVEIVQSGSYSELSQKAIDLYRAELNWKVWAKMMKRIFNETLRLHISKEGTDGRGG